MVHQIINYRITLFHFEFEIHIYNKTELSWNPRGSVEISVAFGDRLFSLVDLKLVRSGYSIPREKVMVGWVKMFLLNNVIVIIK